MLRNKLRYLLLLAAGGLLSILYNAYYMGIIFLAIVMMPFLLFGLLSYCFGKIRAELVTATHVVNKGEMIPISIQLNNPTIFPISCVKAFLTYQNAYSDHKFKKTVTFSLDYRSRTSVICNLSSQYAGNLEITLEGIRIYDYMKLFSLKRKRKGEVRVAVLPDYYEIPGDDLFNNTMQLSDSDSYSHTHKGDDPSEVFEIREYREGDRLQRVHWKLSCKQNQLMIKEFSDPLNCSILLFVNLSIPEGNRVLPFMDALLETVLSLSYTFITKGRQHYLSWYDVKAGSCQRIRVTREKDLFEAVDSLLQAQPYTQESDAVSAYLAEYPHDQYSNLFFVSGEASVLRIESLSAVRADIRQIIYIRDTAHATVKPDITDEILQSCGDAGVYLLPVDISNIRSDMEQLILE